MGVATAEALKEGRGLIPGKGRSRPQSVRVWLTWGEGLVNDLLKEASGRGRSWVV